MSVPPIGRRVRARGPAPAETEPVTWITAAQACELLGVTSGTFYKYVRERDIATRINRAPGGRGRLFNREDVELVKRPRPLDKNTHNKASQRALWRLKERYPVAYAALRAEELERERGSPAGTGNPPTSTHSRPIGKARPV